MTATMPTAPTTPAAAAARGGTRGTAPGCPVAHRYDAFEQAAPFATWAHLRADDPVFFDEVSGYWVVSRYDDVKAVFGDWESFSSEIAHLPVRERGPQAAKIMDDGGFTAYSGLSARVPPEHTRIRNVVSKGFTPRRYAALEPTIREITGRLVEQMLAAPDHRADLLKALCEEIPVVTILALLGIDTERDVETFKRWSAARAAMTWSALTDEEQVPHAHALVEYWQACLDLVADAHANERETLVGDLVRAQRAGDPITDHEIASACYSLLFAGHETTTVLLCNLFRVLLADRKAWGQVVADPSLIPNAIEEVLRISPSLNAWRRLALKDAEVGGVRIPAGAWVLLLMGSANRDEGTFLEPAAFDVTRANAREHLAFGFGIHYCLGNKLAKIEARIVVEEVTRRAPGLRLQDGATTTVPQSLTVNAPSGVPVTWPADAGVTA